jgi:hypothetical protein
MDYVLSLGIDGWKADGSDPYTYLLGIPRRYGGIIHPSNTAIITTGIFTSTHANGWGMIA